MNSINPSQPSVPSPSRPDSWLNWLKARSFLIKLVGAFILIAIVAGFIVWQIWPKPSTPINYSNQDWSKLQSETACSSSSHQAISFQMPQAFSGSTISSSESDFSNGQNDGSMSTTTGSLIAACSDQPTLTTTSLANLKKATTNVGAVTSHTYLSPIYQFVLTHTTSNYNPTFGSITTFSNPYVKSNAWQMSLTFYRNSSVTASVPAEKQGVFIVLAGQKTWYYLLLAATSNNWQANTPAWHTILNSIKIDQ